MDLEGRATVAMVRWGPGVYQQLIWNYRHEDGAPVSIPVVDVRGPSHLSLIWRQFDYWATVYLRTWKGSAITSFVMPLMYIAAFGVLLGGFIDEGSADLEGAPSYLAFVAPGLVAAHAMQIATGEVTWPVMGMIKWHRTYFSMIATPLSVADVVGAQLMFVAFRIATSCGVFLVVLAFFVQILVGLAFGTVIFGYTAGQRNEAGLTVIYRLVMMPLFLFSGAFFPIANLSAPLEWLAILTPLWHGVDLTRMLTLGEVDAFLAAIHLLYLVVMVVVCWWWAVRRLTKRLES